MKSTHVLISGRVQGIGFRAWLTAEAKRLGLSGWVRNVGQNSVEALIAGDTAAVEECLRACRLGPPAAVVDAISSAIAEPPEYPGFVQRPSLPGRP